MDRSEKEQLVTSLHETLKKAELVVVTQQTGLTVAEVTDLRRQMRQAGAGFKVTKNRLARLALEGTQFEGLTPLFTGPTAIAYSADPVAAAKVAVDLRQPNKKLTIVGGALAGQVLDPNGVKALATLPSLDRAAGQDHRHARHAGDARRHRAAGAGGSARACPHSLCVEGRCRLSRCRQQMFKPKEN